MLVGAREYKQKAEDGTKKDQHEITQNAPKATCKLVTESQLMIHVF